MILVILSFIFVLGLLIFVHELGHFAVAKWCGIRVETFSLGFPPKMIGFRKGETEYCISWIPLGGYVKMAGEKPEEEDIQGRPYEFMSKPIWQRALVIFAGPAMNYVLTVVLLFAIYFFQGEPINDPSAKIGLVVAGEPAAAAGLQPGDMIIGVDDSTVASFNDMYRLITNRPGEQVNLSWLRGSDTMSAFVTTRVDTAMDMQGEVVQVGKIGVGKLVEYQPMGLGKAFVEGFLATNEYVAQIFKFLSDVITGSVSSKLIGGPIFIAQAAGEAAKQGFVSVLFLAAILSVNLCVVNLVPIPVLDGGQLLFLLIEKIKGSPVSMRGRAIAQQIGLVFLILLIIFVTKNDIWRINIFGW
ncbi:MAG: RIP metalloprotease RseP [candidate division Zixibacteria bacterium]|nr:RIP metalloprotease RseP [candidate division Zixibacteria bacterium]